MISLSNVDVSLQSPAGRVDILRDLSLDIAAGEAFGLVGPSGSGKSTLLMVIAGLEAVNAGRVEIDGQDITGMGEDALARFRRDHIGIVFQSFHLIATMTALENVAIPLELADARAPMKLAKAELDRVGLGDRLHHYPAQLSGGEQQRVAIARALATGAKILLADEPTGNLDSRTGMAVIDLILSLQKERGMTLFLVTHDEALARHCDRVGTLEDGRLTKITAPVTQARVKTRPNTKRRAASKAAS